MDVQILRIDCANQIRCYRNMGEGFALRVLLRGRQVWPNSVTFQLGAKKLISKIVDPDEPVIHLYTTGWARNNAHIVTHDPDNKVVWYLKRWAPTQPGPPLNDARIIWESWISQKNSAWGYLAALDVPDERDKGLMAEMSKLGASHPTIDLFQNL